MQARAPQFSCCGAFAMMLTDLADGERAPMRLSKKNVLTLLLEESEAMHFASILRAFGGRHLKNDLKRLIDEMLNEGELIRIRGNRYAVPGKHSEGTVQGVISAHRDGYGFLVPEGGGEDVFIPSAALAGALHGDRVSARVGKSRIHRGKFEGRVLSVIERANKRVVGRLQLGSRGAVVVPEELRVTTFFSVPHKALNGALDGQQVVLEVTAWPDGGRPPEGRISEVLGWPDDPDVEVQTVIRKFGLPDVFDEDVLAEAAGVPENVTKADLEGRVDLRRMQTVTIDGETARDFDDAVSIKPEGEKFRLWVSIADVSHYVMPDSPLDREAYLRGTSVYFPDRCIPMLPERLSNGICSLNPGVDRLTLTAEMLFDRSGRMLESSFYPSVIKSSARLTYTIVKEVIVEGNDKALGENIHLAQMLLQMKELALSLQEMRKNRGSIDFDLPEPELVIGLTGKTEAIIKSERNFAHQLIEEFMLAANEAVARFVTERGMQFIYRVHEPPDLQKLTAFRDFIIPFGFTLDINGEKIEPVALQKLIASAAGRPEERMLNYALLRCMKQARYSVANPGHFGLASACYTHFTSPIRRYPDLLVHRLLRFALLLKSDSLSKKQQRELDRMNGNLSEAAEYASSRERLAMEAERDIIELKKLQFMQGRVGHEFEGFIASVTGFGLFVELAEIFVEGLVHLSTISDDIYSFDEKNHALVGRRTTNMLRIGDPVTVRVVSVNPQARRIEFSLVNNATARNSGSSDTEGAGEYPRIPVRGKRPAMKLRR